MKEANLIEKLKECVPELKKRKLVYKRGEIFENSVTNVDEYFTFQNRENAIHKLSTHLTQY